MTREERILMAIEKGYTCNPITGEVFGMKGNVITAVDLKGYNYISTRNLENKRNFIIKCHQFIYYCVHKKCVDCIDHLNGKKHDNRIENLRSVTNQQNCFNTNAKGHYWHKRDEKWFSSIGIDCKQIHLGSFDTEEEARQAYLEAKKIYHI